MPVDGLPPDLEQFAKDAVALGRFHMDWTAENGGIEIARGMALSTMQSSRLVRLDEAFGKLLTP